MPTIKYPKNPNTDTAFVEQDDGTQNRALMIAPQDISTLELPTNSNSTKGYVTIDGKKQRVILTADIGGGGGSSLPDQTGHSGEFLTTDGTDASWGAISEVPSTTGATEGDVLTVDSNGDAVWQAGGGGGSYTAGTGIDITGTTISTEIPMAISSTDSTAPTVTVMSGGTGVIAIGASAKAGSASFGTQSIAIGEGARSSSTLGGSYNVAIGGNSFAGGQGVAIGASTNSGNVSGVAIGYGVRAGSGGIIIGSDVSTSATGTNSGFDIVLYDPATFTSTMYNVIKKGGEINPDRLGTGYDATKTQTLKNVQGVLTWVDD